MAKLLNKKWVFTDDDIDKQIAAGKKLYEKVEKDKPVAVRFRFDPQTRIFSVRIKDGSRIDFPVSKVKELRKASDKEIRSAYITKSGDAIHWDSLDAHYTVAGLAANVFGTKDWMRELAKIGGSKTSAAKATAARSNGLKGGRPRHSTLNSAPASQSRSTHAYGKSAGAGTQRSTKAGGSSRAASSRAQTRKK